MKQHLVELTSEGRGGVAPGRRSVTRNLAESPPDGSTGAGRLSDRLFDAGERLRAEYGGVRIAPRGDHALGAGAHSFHQ